LHVFVLGSDAWQVVCGEIRNEVCGGRGEEEVGGLMESDARKAR
jgi:hypothetical protein